MRKRLVELINSYPCMSTAEDHFMESISDDLADYLIGNNAIVMPCNVGADLWWIDDEDNQIKVEKNGVKGVVYLGDGKFRLLDEVGNIEEFGTNYNYLTREEAEKALEEGDY